MICDIADEHELLVTLEENVYTGGFGERVCHYVEEACLNIKVLNISLPDDYVEHGNVEILKAEEGINVDSVITRVESFYNNM